MRALVTGASGFIGSRLCERLVHEGVEVIRAEGDVRTLQSLPEVELIFHLAGRLSGPPDELWSVNAQGSAHLLSLTPPGTRVVLAGSCEEYGEAPVPFHEDGPLRPRRAYAASKAAASLAAFAAHRERGVETVVARLSVVYGPGGREESFAGGLQAAARAGRPFRMTDGGQTRDFVHVEDAVEGLWRLARCDEAVGSAVNISSGVERRLLEVARETCERAGIPLEAGVLPARPGDLVRYVASNGRCAALLGWVPSRPFDLLE